MVSPLPATATRLLSRLSLLAGLRAERTHYRVEHGIDSTYFNLFPNVRADYKLTANYTASLGYARHIQRPAYERLIPYERFQDTHTSRRGNACLQPEYAHSFSWNNTYKNYSLQFSYTRATLTLSVADLFYQFGSRVSTDIRPVVFENRLRNDTRQVRLAFTFNFGQAGFKSKRVETTTNATERSRLGM